MGSRYVTGGGSLPAARALLQAGRLNELLANPANRGKVLTQLVREESERVFGKTNIPEIPSRITSYAAPELTNYVLNGFKPSPEFRSAAHRLIMRTKRAFTRQLRDDAPQYLDTGTRVPIWAHSMTVGHYGLETVVGSGLSEPRLYEYLATLLLHDVQEDTTKSVVELLNASHVRSLTKQQWTTMRKRLLSANELLTRSTASWYLADMKRTRQSDVADAVKFLVAVAKNTDRAVNGACTVVYDGAKRAKEAWVKNAFVFDYLGRSLLKERGIEQNQELRAVESAVQRNIHVTFEQMMLWRSQLQMQAASRGLDLSEIDQDIYTYIQDGGFVALGKPPGRRQYQSGLQDIDWTVSDAMALLLPKPGDIHKAWKELGEKDPELQEAYRWRASAANPNADVLTSAEEVFVAERDLESAEALYARDFYPELHVPSFMRLSDTRSWTTLYAENTKRQRMVASAINNDPEARYRFVATLELLTAQYALDKNFSLFHGAMR